ncbi:MAG: iron-sulfur cluster assembly scaffold protein [Euryarchaeota archaeon]|nr:iron-sulfur cluster assembly scaffold protein [Euryarchaeota archaeon]
MEKITEKNETSDFDELTKKMEEEILEEERGIYTEKTLEEAYNPKNVGGLEAPSGAARVTGPCGDTLQMHIKVEENKIVDCKFITDGCGASMACGSVVTELVKGKTIEEALTVEDKDVLSALGGLPEENIHCSVLAMDTLRAALEDYKSKSKNKNRNKKRNKKERR